VSLCLKSESVCICPRPCFTYYAITSTLDYFQLLFRITWCSCRFIDLIPPRNVFCRKLPLKGTNTLIQVISLPKFAIWHCDWSEDQPLPATRITIPLKQTITSKWI